MGEFDQLCMRMFLTLKRMKSKFNSEIVTSQISSLTKMNKIKTNLRFFFPITKCATHVVYDNYMFM